MRSLTGDGRLDIMDILLEFTRIVKEGKGIRKEFDLLQQKNRTRLSTEKNARNRRKQNNEFEENVNVPNRQTASSYSSTERLRNHDINMRRMTYSQYKDMLETYALSKGLGFNQRGFAKDNISEKNCF